MARPIIQIATLIAAGLACAASAQAADYRGMTAGWPNYTNGYYAANYPANYGSGAAYYVARPTSAQAAYYAGGAAPSVAYMPVRAAYSNPTYFAAYGVPASPNRAPVAAYYQPATAAYYAPQQASYYPQTAANYAPNYSYAVTPTGSASAGSEAAVAYAQPMAVNYVPARVAYRPAYAAAPVYMYRPVTAYQPVAAQPVNCYQPQTYQPTTCYQPPPSTCGSSSRHHLSWLNPFTWFGHRWGSSGGCGSPPPTTAYCTSNYCQPASCGQPYYPTQPVVPVIPVIPATPAPTFTPIPSGTYIPPAQPRIPSPPTTPRGTLAPADLAPRIVPGAGSFTPVPGSTITPGTTITPGGSFPSVPPGSGSFPTAPGTTAPSFGNPGGFNPGTTFPSGTNYPPTADPYRSSSSTTHNSQSTSSSILRAPELGSPLAPSVQTVPDPDAYHKAQPVNRAPQLLDPRDKSAARADRRWAVVPAVWPTQHRAVSHSERRPAPARAATPVSAPTYDDSGWKSAAY